MKDSKYLNSGDLYDPKTGKPREYTLEIVRVIKGELTGEKGRKATKPVLFFRGARKPFAISSTDGKTIASLVGSPLTERWIGARITLFVTTTSVQGETVECIRVRARAPLASKEVDEIPDLPVEQIFDEAPPAIDDRPPTQPTPEGGKDGGT